MAEDHICQMCGKEVTESQGSPFMWSINAGYNISGPIVPVSGHKVCLENLNKIVLLNRGMISDEIEYLKGQVEHATQQKKMP